MGKYTDRLKDFLQTEKIQEIRRFLILFSKKPVEAMGQVPHWDWRISIKLAGLFASVSGLLTGLVDQSILQALVGFFFFPIGNILAVLVGSAFFYYGFFFFFKQRIDFERILIIVTLSSIPYLTFHIISPFIEPINLVGLAFSAILMAVGFVENLQTPKKGTLRLIALVFLVYLTTWILGMIDLGKERSDFRELATPESLDILQKELGQ